MARRIMRWIGKALLWAVGAFLVLAVAGALYQLIATEVDERRYPPPGELVDVGGYRLHVHCIGQGSPTVILDHLGEGMSSQWVWVQSEVSNVTRVCAYDRAGFGWSDPGPAPRAALAPRGNWKYYCATPLSTAHTCWSGTPMEPTSGGSTPASTPTR